MNSPVLILTATIQPIGGQRLALAAATDRKRQYLEALRRWLADTHDGTPIVLIENSGADLADFKLLAEAFPARLVELLSIPASHSNPTAGKGFGEFEMIDAAFTQSRLLRTADCCVKITGRLTIANWRPMLWKLPASFDLIADAHLVPNDPNGGRIDSRLVFFSTAFYRQHVLGLYRTMNDANGYFAEHALFNVMQNAPPDAKLFTRLPLEPRWRGGSASTGERYDDWRARLKWPLKALRRLRDLKRNRPSVDDVRTARRQVD